MNKENCVLKLVDEIILYYDARSRKHRILFMWEFDPLLTKHTHTHTHTQMHIHWTYDI